MKKMKLVSLLIFCFFAFGILEAQVTYKLSYDFATATYTVSATSAAAYTGNGARMTGSTQVTIVAPATAGGFQVTNVTSLQAGATPLNWSNALEATPSENAAADYLLFNPNNYTTYSPFNFPAGMEVDLFSFQSNSGCQGDLSLFDNTTDPFNASVTQTPQSNFVVLAGGNNNQYTGNTSGAVTCVAPCESEAGSLSY